MSLDGRVVLVTGATGWLGQALLDALVHGLPDRADLATAPRGTRLRALALADEAAALAAAWPDVEVTPGDVRSEDDARRFCAGARGGVVFHLAGVIHPRRVHDFYTVNVEGTRHVLDAAVASGVERAVVMSSNSPFGCNPHPDHRFDEASPYRPYRHYGRSKMLLERCVADVARRTGLETVVLRAPWFYGPYQPPRQTEFFAMIQAGRAPIVGGGTGRRSMTYVGNLAQALMLAATTPAAAGRAYWVADAEPYAMTDIVDTVERLLETEFDRPCAHRRLRLPGVVSEVAGLADWALQAAGYYHAKVHVLSEMNKTIACSIARARRELGYVPTVALEEGMRRSLRWLAERDLLPARRR